MARPPERRGTRAGVQGRAPSATSRGWAAAAAPRSAGSRPANSAGLGAPAGITCSRPRRARTPAAPPPLQLASSPRPLQTGRAAAGRAAAAPSLRPARAHTRPDASAAAAAARSGFHCDSARGPASRRATPSDHAHRAPRGSSTAATRRAAAKPMAFRLRVGGSGAERRGERRLHPRPRPPPRASAAHTPPSHPQQWSSCVGLAGAGWRAQRGHWLPRRDPRWATVTHWLLPGVRWTGSDRDPPP